MNLPVQFLERMKAKLGDSFPAFLSAYETPAVRGLRVNVLKITREEFLKRSPFPLEACSFDKNGFYCSAERAGSDPYHFAGLYYMQEPSAMCAAPLLKVERGERVLDLCAAPGGKAGQLASELGGTGLLVCNEYDAQRSKVLAGNLERLGVKNAVVVNTDSGRLANLGAIFDKILVDAPCSGEGMFKKEANALPEWSQANVARCARRQSAILSDAARLLKEGGRLVYSTCTFSDEENEEQIACFLRSHAQFRLEDKHTVYPHLERGEGHFAAVMTKTGGGRESVKPFPVLKNERAEHAYREFAKDFFSDGRGHEGRITTLADGRMMMLGEGAVALNGVRVLRAGIELGSWDGKLFRPAHALAMSAKREEVRFLSLTRAECEEYLAGREICGDIENGWCVVGVEDYPLGLGKAVNGVVKNHLPKGLRRYGAR